MPKSESKPTKRTLSNGKSHAKITEVFPEVGRRIKVYRNGDPYDAGINVVLNMRKIHDIGTFLDVINDRIYLVNGAKRLYTTNGQLVRKTSELQNGKEYVASSGPFTPLNYGKRALQREHSMSNMRSSSKTSSTNSRSKSMEPTQRKKKTEKSKTTTIANGTKPVSNGGFAMQRSKSFVHPKIVKEVQKVTSVPAKKVKQVTNGIPSTPAIKKPSTGIKQEVKKVKREVNETKQKAVKEKKKVVAVAAETPKENTTQGIQKDLKQDLEATLNPLIRREKNPTTVKLRNTRLVRITPKNPAELILENLITRNIPLITRNTPLVTRHLDLPEVGLILNLSDLRNLDRKDLGVPPEAGHHPNIPNIQSILIK